ncbi:MAG: hypothetical protein M3Q14_02610 [bacterium]|nr:hypothetical protein [bacterium]
MSNYAISLKRTSLLLATLAFTAALLVANLSIFGFGIVDAAQLSTRSMTISSSLGGGNSTGAANSETNGADSTHTFTFDAGTTGTIRALKFEYCTTAINACTGPAGMDADTTPAVLTQTNEGVTFTNLYAINAGSSTNTTLLYTNATGNTFTAGTGGTIVFAVDDVTNPTSTGNYFVRMTTYSDAAATTAVDNGTVAFSITTGIAITSKVVETLGFSTTAQVNTTNVPAEGSSCTPVTGTGAIALGDVTEGTLSISQAYDAFSAFRLHTNAGNGVVVQYAGNTLVKGTDNINAIGGTATASAVGSEQFGLAVDPAAQGGAGNYANFDTTWPLNTAGRLELGTEYDGGTGTIVNGGTATFAYDAATPATPKTMAASDTAFGGYITCDTALVRYIGNIAPTTAAGTYTTTVVYFAVPTY